MNTTLNPSPDTPDTPEKRERDLASMQKKVDSARALLVRLLQELVFAESQLGRNRPAAMLEANEQLVLASLRHQAEVEAAAQAVQTMSRSVGIDPLPVLQRRRAGPSGALGGPVEAKPCVAKLLTERCRHVPGTVLPALDRRADQTAGWPIRG